MRRVGRVMAGISAGRRKLEMTRRRCGIGKGERLGEFREAGNVFNFVGGEIPVRPTFAEILAWWLGVVVVTGRRGSAGDEIGERVKALGRNWQGGRRERECDPRQTSRPVPTGIRAGSRE